MNSKKSHLIRFTGKVLIVLAGIITSLRLIGLAVKLSPWNGYVITAIIACVMYVTVPRWVTWLPGILVFGIMSSLGGLLTHRAPTNPGVEVSSSLPIAALLYQLVGYTAARQYGASKLSVLDRCAVVIYLICMI